MNTLISNRNSFRERQKKLQKNAVFLVFVNTDCVRGRRIFLRKQMQNKKWVRQGDREFHALSKYLFIFSKRCSKGDKKVKKLF